MPTMEAARVVYYTAKCRNCYWTRSFLRAVITAETKSTVHALRRHHIVDITAVDVQSLSPHHHLTVPNAEQIQALTFPEEAPY